MKRLVIIDDEPELRALLAKAVAPRFECVAQAGNGSDGIEAVQRVQPDLVLLDLGMPDMDGLECLRAIRSQERRVIVYTGYRGARLEAVVQELGAAGFVHKGATVEALLDAMVDAMASPVPPVLNRDARLRHRLHDLV
ncbi:MAG: response regulator [Thermoplasmatota archaeon]